MESSVYWMVMCGNPMLIRTDAILKLEILVGWISLRIWWDFWIQMHALSVICAYTVLHLLYLCLLDWCASECKPANPRGISQGKTGSTAQNHAQSILSLINMCIYKKWVNSKKKCEQRTNMHSQDYCKQTLTEWETLCAYQCFQLVISEGCGTGF